MENGFAGSADGGKGRKKQMEPDQGSTGSNESPVKGERSQEIGEAVEAVGANGWMDDVDAAGREPRPSSNTVKHPPSGRQPRILKHAGRWILPNSLSL